MNNILCVFPIVPKSLIFFSFYSSFSSNIWNKAHILSTIHLYLLKYQRQFWIFFFPRCLSAYASLVKKHFVDKKLWTPFPQITNKHDRFHVINSRRRNTLFPSLLSSSLISFWYVYFRFIISSGEANKRRFFLQPPILS